MSHKHIVRYHHKAHGFLARHRYAILVTLIVVLFIAAIVLRGEAQHISLAVIASRILDSFGDVATDSLIHGGD